MFFQVVSDHMNDDKKLHSNMHIAYSVRNSLPNVLTTDIVYDKTAQTFRAAAETSTSTTEIQAGWRTRGLVHSHELEVLHNNIRVVQTDLSLNGHVPSATCKIRTRERVDITVFSGLQENSQAMFLVSHSFKGAEMEDLRMKIALQDGNSISGLIDWRHDVLQKIQTNMRVIAGSLEAAISEEPWNDLENCVNILETAAKDITGDLVRLTNIELNQLFIQIKHVTSSARRLAQGSGLEALVGYYTASLEVFADFGVEVADEIQVILRASTKALHSTAGYIFDTLKHGMEALKSRGINIKNQILYLLKNFSTVFGKIGNKMETAIWKAKHLIDSVANRYHKFVNLYMERSARFRGQLWEAVSTEVSQFVTSVAEALNKFVVIQRLVQVVQRLVEWIKDNNPLDKLKQAYGTVETYIQDNFQDLLVVWNKVKGWYHEATAWLVEKYEAACEWPPMAVVLSLARHWLSLARELLNFYLKGYSIRHVTDMAISRLGFYTSTILRVANFVYYNDELISYDFIFKPEEGLLHYTQVLPIQWDKFSEVPKIFNIFGHYEQPSSPDITSFYFSMHNLVRTLYQALSSQTVLPPFSAIAMVIGNNQFMTFDKKFFDFSGNCSYLLTKDFNHNHFSVVANYRNEIRESLSIQLEDQTIKVNTDGKVLLGRTMIDLPYSFNETFIWKEGDRIFFLNKMGLQVICNLLFNSCSIKISGWYFAKTGGLLGVYDNEASNDWMTSRRTIVPEVATFADSWKEADSCLSSTYTPIQPDLTEWEMDKCTDYFYSGESIMKPCFEVVDPTPFLDMCHRQSEYVKWQPSDSEGFCQVTSAYIEVCKLQGIELRLPGECYSCEAPGKATERGGGFTNYFNSSAPRSADVIFVVQQGPCLDSLKFPTITGLLESSLQEAGLTSNHYAVVGYGGPGELRDPITFTAASRVFSDHDTVLQALNRLSNISGDGGDVADAITFAARIPPRPAVGRVMVVITCDKITDGSFYGDSIVMLKEGMIKLHYLNPAALYLKNKKNMRTIYGFDKTSVFTAKSMNSAKGEMTLRSQMKVPKDYMSTLATESGGSVFSQTVLDRTFRYTRQHCRPIGGFFSRPSPKAGRELQTELNRRIINEWRMTLSKP